MNLHIYCQIVDNYGDIGIAYRLAKTLASIDPSFQIYLWFSKDVPIEFSFKDITPNIYIDTITKSSSIEPGFTITTFSSYIPEALCDINTFHLDLGYLKFNESNLKFSQTGRHSFYPGFKEGFLLGNYIPKVKILHKEDISISWFTYKKEIPSFLLKAWINSDAIIKVYSSQLSNFKEGNLEIINIPFLSQNEYDDLLSTCHINFVRGEDSFVRSQLSGNLTIWSPYNTSISINPMDTLHTTFIKAYTNLWYPDDKKVYEKFVDDFLTNSSKDENIWYKLMYILPSLTPKLLSWREYLLSLGCISHKLYSHIPIIK